MVDDIRGQRPSRSVGADTSAEPRFQPPETVAEADIEIDMNNLPDTSVFPATKPNEPTVKEPKRPGKIKVLLGDIKYWFNNRSKKQKVAIISGLIIGLFAVSVGIYLLIRPEAKTEAPAVVEKKEEVKEAPKPTTEASRLTGLQVPPEYNKLTVTGVMIENSPDARPQAGLKDAGVVFEAIAEGGITRFLALYQEAQPEYLGPVRSVRPYYLSWLKAFDAGIAHAGGSPEALAKIRREGFKDLDQAFNGGAYQRVKNRAAPHNLYTSRGNLIALEKSKGFNSSTFSGFARKQDQPISPATARVINLRISSGLYNVHYDYDAASNSYLRSQGGKPHTDERSKAQIAPKVVIAIILPQGIHPDGVHMTYGTVGSGKAYIFQDGDVTQGTWSKSSDKEQILFGDANGSPIGINAGQTWITALGDASRVTFGP